MNFLNTLSWILNSIQSSHSEHIVLQNLLYTFTPLVQMFFQLSSLTIEYPNIWFNSSSLTFLVPIYANYRPPSNHTVFWILHSSSFITKFILLEMCLVCFVSLSLSAIHIDDLPSNIIRGACYGTTSGFFFKNSLFSILECARDIPAVCASLY